MAETRSCRYCQTSFTRNTFEEVLKALADHILEEHPEVGRR